MKNILFLKFFPQIYHITEQNSLLDDRMVIVVGEEVGDAGAVNKAVFLIEGQSERAFPGAQLHAVELVRTALTE